MKIGITCYPTYGGSGVVATELGIALAKRGHQIHFISYALPFRLQRFYENIYFHEVPVTNYPLFKYPSYDLALAAEMMEVTEQFGLEVLHVHYAIPHAACAYLTRQMMGERSPKIITTLHGTDITLVGSDKSFFPITQFSIEQSDGVTSVSEFLKQETIRLFHTKNPIRVIPNFVDTHEFTGKAKDCSRKHFAPQKEKVLMHVSNFRPVKRVQDIIQVFAKVHSQIPTKLILIGEGPEKEPALDLAKSLGVKQDVVCLGMQDTLPDILPCADLYLLPSNKESFGLSALEALARGVPVIGTNVGGMPEVVTDGQTGVLRPVGDIEGMAEGALKLLTDTEMMAQFKSKARQVAVEKFDVEQGVSQYENYYHEILEGNKK
jgi:N-acetyl-alpha-D-glucosaminyl L-malate synthase BshA